MQFLPAFLMDICIGLGFVLGIFLVFRLRTKKFI
jgi:uncharacterized protein YneF (UPF0154 family)